MIDVGPVGRRFILHWGELGSRWGINRSVAQIHALLYLSPEPLDAATIANALQIARSNVSTSLRELIGWGIVRTVHVLGDRRDRFEAISDVLQTFSILTAQRRTREVDPTLAVLRECSDKLKGTGGEQAYTKERITEMLQIFEAGTALLDQVQSLPLPLLKKFFQIGGKIRAILGRVS